MDNFNNFKPISQNRHIAIPSRNNMVDDHFGHCEYYTIVTIEKNQIIAKEILHAPTGCGCKSNIADTLKEKNVSEMLAGNIGQGAINKLNQAGIQVLRGCSGNVDQLIESYTKGLITDNGQICSQHEDGHECSNH